MRVGKHAFIRRLSLQTGIIPKTRLKITRHYGLISRAHKGIPSGRYYLLIATTRDKGRSDV